MSKLSTTLTVKEGSTTKTVNLYSSTSDMSNSSYTNEYLTCKCNGSTAYIAVASSGTTAYTNYGTALKYKNSSGTIKYILTEPYLPSTPSYSGTITIPTQTIYTTGSAGTSNDYTSSGTTTVYTSESFYLNTGDTVTVNACTNAYRLQEGTASYSSGTTNISQSTITLSIAIGSFGTKSTTITGRGDGNEGNSTYASLTSSTYTYTGSGVSATIRLQYSNAQLRSGRTSVSVYNAITIKVN